MSDKKPKHFITLKIVGFIGIAVAIIGFILSVTGFGDFESNNFMIGGALACLGLFVSVPCLVLGFGPEISKMNVKTQKWIQDQNKEDLTDIASTKADINKEAITTTIKAVKDGLQNEIYCKHCGEKIDADSKFCKACGKEQ